MIAQQLTFLCIAAFFGGRRQFGGGRRNVTGPFPALTWDHGFDGGCRRRDGQRPPYRRSLSRFPSRRSGAIDEKMAGLGRWVLPLMIPSVLGSILGTWLVVTQPEKIFQEMVPWLILAASALFLLQPAITKWTGIGQPHAQPSQSTMAGIVLFQFLIAVYGGYFGAGIGILMLSSLALMGLGDIHRMNALKSLLASTINGMSVVMFVLHGRVYWAYGIPMIIAGIAGGFVGASVSRRLDKNVVRWVVIAIGFGLATYYFTRVYLPTRTA